MEWDESKHPRAEDGKFTDGTGSYRQNTSYNEILKADEKPKKKLAITAGEKLHERILADKDGKMTIDEITNDPLITEAEKRFTVSDDQWTSHIHTPERENLRKAIAEDILTRGSISGKDQFEGKVQKGFRAEIVIGPPAGGKSSVIVDKVSKNTGSMVLDSDEIKKLLPEFDGGNGAGRVHEESSDILNEKVIPEFYKGGSQTGKNIVIPIVGKKAKHAEEYLANLKAAGYEVHLSFNDVTALNSAKRATTRYIETGRFLSPNYIKSVGNAPSQTYESLKSQGGFDSYTKYDNNVPFGQPAKKIERVDGKGNSVKWEDWQ